MTKATNDKANALVERAAEWLKVKDASGQQVGYGVPGTTKGTYHLTDGHTCTCRGYQHHGYCAHSAAALRYRLAKKEAAQAASTFPCMECGRELPVGGAICQTCDDLADDLDALYPGVAA